MLIMPAERRTFSDSDDDIAEATGGPTDNARGEAYFLRHEILSCASYPMVLIMPAERRTFSDIDRTPSFLPDTVLIMPAERRTFSDSAIGARLRPKSINLTMPAERRTFSDVTIIDFS